MYYQIAGTNIRTMGSCHLFPKGVEDVPYWAVSAFNWADKIFFEVDSAKTIPFFKSEDNKDLRNIIPSKVWEYLSSIWPENGAIYALNEIRLWAVLLIAPMFVMDVEQGIEPRFAQWAREQSKVVSFLESPKQFIEILESVPQNDILAALDLFVGNASSQNQLINEVYDAWSSLDIEKTYDIATKAPSFEIQSLREALLNSRNKMWASVVKKILSDEINTLVVVGALHLHGDNNLLSILDLPLIKLSSRR